MAGDLGNFHENDSLPRVSVVIPAHNAAATIGHTIASACGQTLRDLEVIVVDDGSTDATAETVHQIAQTHPRVRLIRQENAGVATARNRGIAAARGTYIAPLDADDLGSRVNFTAQVERMERGGSDMGVVSCWWLTAKATPDSVEPTYGWRIEGRVFNELLRINFIGCASLPLIRRSALEAVGGYEADFQHQNAQGCEDWDLSLRLAERYEFGLVPEYLAIYRHTPTSMSTQTDQMLRSHQLMLDRLRQRQPDVDPGLMRASQAEITAHLGAIRLRNGDLAGALRLGFRAIKTSPQLLGRRWVLMSLWLKISKVFRKRERQQWVTRSTPVLNPRPPK